MLFHDSKDESAWGLALVAVIVVTMAAFLGEVTGDVQPKAPVEITHEDTSSPALHEKVEPPLQHPQIDPSKPAPAAK
jgi:hypothetical protein